MSASPFVKSTPDLAPRGHVVAGVEFRLDHLSRQRNFENVRAIDERCDSIALERKEASLEIKDVTDPFGSGANLARAREEKHPGQRGAGDESHFGRFTPFLNPEFGHRTEPYRRDV